VGEKMIVLVEEQKWRRTINKNILHTSRMA